MSDAFRLKVYFAKNRTTPKSERIRRLSSRFFTYLISMGVKDNEFVFGKCTAALQAARRFKKAGARVSLMHRRKRVTKCPRSSR